MALAKIGFGGGCHWCTEAYFQSLRGVKEVEQGWISSAHPNDAFSEAVIVHYDPTVISLKILIAIHLHTHAATKTHSFRRKYRSAIYVFDGEMERSQEVIREHQIDFEARLITEVLPFAAFKENTENYRSYYQKNKNGAFCQTYIIPKLKMLEADYAVCFSLV